METNCFTRLHSIEPLELMRLGLKGSYYASLPNNESNCSIVSREGKLANAFGSLSAYSLQEGHAERELWRETTGTLAWIRSGEQNAVLPQSPRP